MSSYMQQTLRLSLAAQRYRLAAGLGRQYWCHDKPHCTLDEMGRELRRMGLLVDQNGGPV